jgi:hypothetical protein
VRRRLFGDKRIPRSVNPAYNFSASRSARAATRRAAPLPTAGGAPSDGGWRPLSLIAGRRPPPSVAVPCRVLSVNRTRFLMSSRLEDTSEPWVKGPGRGGSSAQVEVAVSVGVPS